MLDMALQYITTIIDWNSLALESGTSIINVRLPPGIATSTDMAGILALRAMGLEVAVEMLLTVERLSTSRNSASHALNRRRWARDHY